MAKSGKMFAEHLVLDAGAIIQANLQQTDAACFYTVPEVVQEIRDRRAKEKLDRLASLPFKIVSPTPQAIQTGNGRRG